MRDAGQLGTRFGRLLLAAGTVGEVGLILVMSLVLAREHSPWHQGGFLLVFLATTVLAAVIGVRGKTPTVLAVFTRTLRSSTQLPVRVSLLLLGTYLLLAEGLGLEHVLGAFSAGMIVGLATRGPDGEPLREKIGAVCFGWFTPFFFVTTGIKFNVDALTQGPATLLLVAAFLAIFLFVRGVPIFLYRGETAKGAAALGAVHRGAVRVARDRHYRDRDAGGQHPTGHRGGPHRGRHAVHPPLPNARQWPIIEEHGIVGGGTLTPPNETETRT